MLADVLSTLRKSRNISSATVVSADKNAMRIVRRFGAHFVWEGRRRGLNKGLRLAIRKSEQRGCSGVLVIHADLPLLTPKEIERFLSRARGYPVALNPSKDGSGTNALLLKPPQVIQPTFGKGSFRKHVSLTNQKKVRYRVMRFRGISFDVDEPIDLRKLMHQRIQNETGRFLLAIRRRNHESTEGESHLP
jgi:2-phospho-L-lactate guanylyltransferase